MWDSLRRYFSYAEFRPGQREVIESILADKDTVALMPTGGGKSLCFQLPALLRPGVTVVISPLISLMKDQVDGLSARGIPATFINSSVNAAENQRRMREITAGKIKIVYAAPERLSNAGFQDWFNRVKVGFLAVDEAHCVSQWGHDFRPDYLKIASQINKLRNRPVIAAFTATATPEVKDDIIHRLGLKNPAVFVRGFDRPNLQFFVRSKMKVRERQKEVLRMIKALEGSGIVYALTRKETEEMAKWLNKEGIGAVAYHAGLPDGQRTKIQEEFMENQHQVIVATVAFGMGVDKADIRFVIHMGMPGSLEGYYQEAGRAGRDGERAFCVLLHSGKDTGLHYHFLQQSKEEMKKQGKPGTEIRAVTEVKYKKLQKMVGYATEPGCRRRQILEYFGDQDVNRLGKGCGNCDFCLNYQWTKDELADGKVKRGGSETITGDDKFMPEYKTRKTKQSKDNGLSATIQESVKLYQQQKNPEQIAKIRNLGVSTILGHLTQWYVQGGKFDPDNYVSREEQKLILQAMARAEDYQRLGSIKQQLPENIGYEKIKLVIAKIQWVKL